MAIVVLVIALGGCASTRYLSEAEDADLRAKCEPTGCTAIPNPLWLQIQQLLRALAGRLT